MRHHVLVAFNVLCAMACASACRYSNEVDSSGCCRQYGTQNAGECPSSCSSQSTSINNYVASCTCSGCDTFSAPGDKCTLADLTAIKTATGGSFAPSRGLTYSGLSASCNACLTAAQSAGSLGNAQSKYCILGAQAVTRLVQSMGMGIGTVALSVGTSPTPAPAHSVVANVYTDAGCMQPAFSAKSPMPMTFINNKPGKPKATTPSTFTSCDTAWNILFDTATTPGQCAPMDSNPTTLWGKYSCTINPQPPPPPPSSSGGAVVYVLLVLVLLGGGAVAALFFMKKGPFEPKEDGGLYQAEGNQ